MSRVATRSELGAGTDVLQSIDKPRPGVVLQSSKQDVVSRVGWGGVGAV